MYQVWVEHERLQKTELTNNPSFVIKEIDGLAKLDSSINTTVIANSDGSLFNSSRVNDKPIAITILPQFPVEENRQLLYKYFRMGKPVKLYYKNQNRDVFINGYVSDRDGSLFEMLQTIIIEIKCNKPFFEDRLTTIKGMSQVLNMFEFPFTIEEDGIEFSTIDKELTQNIYNAGDRETGIIIELEASGEVINPIIYNVDTRESFGINITMQLGDLIRINTNKSNKKIELIRYGESRNIINNVMKNPKWFQLDIGDNLFTYVCESGEEFLNFKFIYANLYEGV